MMESMSLENDLSGICISQVAVESMQNLVLKSCFLFLSPVCLIRG